MEFYHGTHSQSILQSLFKQIESEVGKVMVGQQSVLHRVLLGLAQWSHLIEGVPGLAKTLLIQTLSEVIDADFSRIQFTPDMLPGDVTGTQFLIPKKAPFNSKGACVCQFGFGR